MSRFAPLRPGPARPLRHAFALTALLALAALLAFACGGGDFDPQSKVDSVRLFGVRADKPYARPGETVNLEILGTDGRKEKPRPLKTFWIPLVCMNPPNDLYYLCFAAALGGSSDGGTGGNANAGAGATRGPTFFPAGPFADAGAGGAAGAATGNPLANIPRGVDLSAFLPQGDTFSFTMPADAIQPRVGTDPYGLAILFNIACAGQVRLAELDPTGGAQQVPIQCTDESGVPLPPSDYVIGISRVYAYETRTNTNPVIEKLTFEGQDVDVAKGITLDRCTDVKRTDCPEKKLDVRVSDSSWEENPSEVIDGRVLREQIWASLYSDKGDLEVEARLLFDTTKGRPSKTEVKFKAAAEPGTGTIWAFVHDNRGGAAWLVVPVTVK
jgi:hypothetical protein